MELKKNNSKSLFGQEMNFNKQDKRSLLKKIFDSQVLFGSQVFFNSRLVAFDYMEKLGNLVTAMLTVKISKVRGILGTNYEIKLSLLYSKNADEIRKAENFYKVEMPGKEGLIPNYVLNELDKGDSDSVDIKFNKADLSALYEERNVTIDEDATFEDVVALCKRKDVTSILLIDRVFYTRIVCYDSAKQEIGAIHIGALRRLPNGLAEKLYPGGSVEYTLQ